MRRPISLNIYGITGLLLMLMALVALISSINLSRVDRQTTLLSPYYIRLDQTLSDIRDHNLIQALLLERALVAHAQLDTLPQARKIVLASAQELGDAITKPSRGQPEAVRVGPGESGPVIAWLRVQSLLRRRRDATRRGVGEQGAELALRRAIAWILLFNQSLTARCGSRLDE